MNRLDLGSICILLEDLGFKYRKTNVTYNNDVINMTYHCHIAEYLYSKIFADINQTWVLEVCLVPEELHIDLWNQKETGLFIVNNDLSLNLCDPKSIIVMIEYIEKSIKVANASN